MNGSGSRKQCAVNGCGRGNSADRSRSGDQKYVDKKEEDRKLRWLQLRLQRLSTLGDGAFLKMPRLLSFLF